MIVHNLNLGNDRPIFSDKLINLENLEIENNALDFFREHIRNSRGQSSTKQCKFNLNIANHVKGSIIDLHKTYYSDGDQFEDRFIEKSKLLTDHLANSMRNKSRSDGSVFIFLYFYNGEEYLGILKMDPNLGIQVKDDLTLKVRDQMLPSTKEKLHKSAFIKFKDDFSGDDTHLFVLDRQQTKDEPAKYFMNDFLNAIEKANNDNLTIAFEREIKNEIVFNIESPKDKSIFNSRLKTRLSEDSMFNLDEDLPQLTRGLLTDGFALNECIDNIKSNVLKKYPDATFEFVPNPDKVKDLDFKSDDSRVVIKIKGNLSRELFSYKMDEETGETIFKFSSILNVTPRG